MGSRGVLLFGGSNALPRSGGVLQKDVWLLRDGKWTAAAAELPFISDVRFGADVTVWDPDTARVVAITDVGAVYVYDPVADRWERRATSGGPRAVDSLRGAYDPKSRRVLVFGGADTWAYDVTANTWSQLSPRTSAPPRRWTAVVRHARPEVFVMFGGTDLGDTWTYDASTNEWKEMKPALAPSGRKYHAMAYDERADRIVLFGGGPHRDAYSAETWVFDTTASSWSHLTTSP